MSVGFLRGLFIVQVVLLTVLFMFGNFISLYRIPIKVNFLFFSYTGIGLEVHHYIAVSTLILGMLAIVFSLKKKNALLSKLSISGLILLVSAFASGVAFVFLQENNLYTIAMATFFISALITFMSALFLVKR
jgi:hypothetical protein